MWSFVVLIVMTSLTGFYATVGKERIASAEQFKADTLADSMAIYREAAINYFTTNPTLYASVPITTLIASHSLPSWSPLYTEPATSIWANYRDTNGLIYIYASRPTAVNIVADIARLSQNSILTGIYRTGDTRLYSPIFGQTNIPLPPPAVVSIPDGSPIWIGMIK